MGRADKGIIITTGSFTSDARKKPYARGASDRAGGRRKTREHAGAG